MAKEDEFNIEQVEEVDPVAEQDISTITELIEYFGRTQNYEKAKKYIIFEFYKRSGYNTAVELGELSGTSMMSPTDLKSNMGIFLKKNYNAQLKKFATTAEHLVQRIDRDKYENLDLRNETDIAILKEIEGLYLASLQEYESYGVDYEKLKTEARQISQQMGISPEMDERLKIELRRKEESMTEKADKAFQFLLAKLQNNDVVRRMLDMSVGKLNINDTGYDNIRKQYYTGADFNVEETLSKEIRSYIEVMPLYHLKSNGKGSLIFDANTSVTLRFQYPREFVDFDLLNRHLKDAAQRALEHQANSGMLRLDFANALFYELYSMAQEAEAKMKGDSSEVVDNLYSFLYHFVNVSEFKFGTIEKSFNSYDKIINGELLEQSILVPHIELLKPQRLYAKYGINFNEAYKSLDEGSKADLWTEIDNWDRMDVTQQNELKNNLLSFGISSTDLDRIRIIRQKSKWSTALVSAFEAHYGSMVHYPGIAMTYSSESDSFEVNVKSTTNTSVLKKKIFNGLARFVKGGSKEYNLKKAVNGKYNIYVEETADGANVWHIPTRTVINNMQDLARFENSRTLIVSFDSTSKHFKFPAESTSPNSIYKYAGIISKAMSVLFGSRLGLNTDFWRAAMLEGRGNYSKGISEYDHRALSDLIGMSFYMFKQLADFSKVSIKEREERRKAVAKAVANIQSLSKDIIYESRLFTYEQENRRNDISSAINELNQNRNNITEKEYNDKLNVLEDELETTDIPSLESLSCMINALADFASKNSSLAISEYTSGKKGRYYNWVLTRVMDNIFKFANVKNARPATFAARKFFEPVIKGLHPLNFLFNTSTGKVNNAILSGLANFRKMEFISKYTFYGNTKEVGDLTDQDIHTVKIFGVFMDSIRRYSKAGKIIAFDTIPMIYGNRKKVMVINAFNMTSTNHGTDLASIFMTGKTLKMFKSNYGVMLDGISSVMDMKHQQAKISLSKWLALISMGRIVAPNVELKNILVSAGIKLMPFSINNNDLPFNKEAFNEQTKAVLSSLDAMFKNLTPDEYFQVMSRIANIVNEKIKTSYGKDLDKAGLLFSYHGLNKHNDYGVTDTEGSIKLSIGFDAGMHEIFSFDNMRLWYRNYKLFNNKQISADEMMVPTRSIFSAGYNDLVNNLNYGLKATKVKLRNGVEDLLPLEKDEKGGPFFKFKEDSAKNRTYTWNPFLEFYYFYNDIIVHNSFASLTSGDENQFPSYMEQSARSTGSQTPAWLPTFGRPDQMARKQRVLFVSERVLDHEIVKATGYKSKVELFNSTVYGDSLFTFGMANSFGGDSSIISPDQSVYKPRYNGMDPETGRVIDVKCTIQTINSDLYHNSPSFRALHKLMLTGAGMNKILYPKFEEYMKEAQDVKNTFLKKLYDDIVKSYAINEKLRATNPEAEFINRKAKTIEAISKLYAFSKHIPISRALTNSEQEMILQIIADFESQDPNFEIPPYHPYDTMRYSDYDYATQKLWTWIKNYREANNIDPMEGSISMIIPPSAAKIETTYINDVDIFSEEALNDPDINARLITKELDMMNFMNILNPVITKTEVTRPVQPLSTIAIGSEKNAEAGRRIQELQNQIVRALIADVLTITNDPTLSNTERFNAIQSYMRQSLSKAADNMPALSELARKVQNLNVSMSDQSIHERTYIKLFKDLQNAIQNKMPGSKLNQETNVLEYYIARDSEGNEFVITQQEAEENDDLMRLVVIDSTTGLPQKRGVQHKSFIMNVDGQDVIADDYFKTIDAKIKALPISSQKQARADEVEKAHSMAKRYIAPEKTQPRSVFKHYFKFTGGLVKLNPRHLNELLILKYVDLSGDIKFLNVREFVRANSKQTQNDTPDYYLKANRIRGYNALKEKLETIAEFSQIVEDKRVLNKKGRYLLDYYTDLLEALIVYSTRIPHSNWGSGNVAEIIHLTDADGISMVPALEMALNNSDNDGDQETNIIKLSLPGFGTMASKWNPRLSKSKSKIKMMIAEANREIHEIMTETMSRPENTDMMFAVVSDEDIATVTRGKFDREEKSMISRSVIDAASLKVFPNMDMIGIFANLITATGRMQFPKNAKDIFKNLYIDNSTEAKVFSDKISQFLQSAVDATKKQRLHHLSMYPETAQLIVAMSRKMSFAEIMSFIENRDIKQVLDSVLQSKSFGEESKNLYDEIDQKLTYLNKSILKDDGVKAFSEAIQKMYEGRLAFYKGELNDYIDKKEQDLPPVSEVALAFNEIPKADNILYTSEDEENFDKAADPDTKKISIPFVKGRITYYTNLLESNKFAEHIQKRIDTVGTKVDILSMLMEYYLEGEAMGMVSKIYALYQGFQTLPTQNRRQLKGLSDIFLQDIEDLMTKKTDIEEKVKYLENKLSMSYSKESSKNMIFSTNGNVDQSKIDSSAQDIVTSLIDTYSTNDPNKPLQKKVSISIVNTGETGFEEAFLKASVGANLQTTVISDGLYTTMTGLRSSMEPNNRFGPGVNVVKAQRSEKLAKLVELSDVIVILYMGDMNSYQKKIVSLAKEKYKTTKKGFTIPINLSLIAMESEQTTFETFKSNVISRLNSSFTSAMSEQRDGSTTPMTISFTGETLNSFYIKRKSEFERAFDRGIAIREQVNFDEVAKNDSIVSQAIKYVNEVTQNILPYLSYMSAPAAMEFKKHMQSVQKMDFLTNKFEDVMNNGIHAVANHLFFKNYYHDPNLHNFLTSVKIPANGGLYDLDLTRIEDRTRFRLLFPDFIETFNVFTSPKLGGEDRFQHAIYYNENGFVVFDTSNLSKEGLARLQKDYDTIDERYAEYNENGEISFQKLFFLYTKLTIAQTMKFGSLSRLTSKFDGIYKETMDRITRDLVDNSFAGDAFREFFFGKRTFTNGEVDYNIEDSIAARYYTDLPVFGIKRKIMPKYYKESRTFKTNTGGKFRIREGRKEQKSMFFTGSGAEQLIDPSRKMISEYETVHLKNADQIDSFLLTSVVEVKYENMPSYKVGQVVYISGISENDASSLAVVVENINRVVKFNKIPDTAIDKNYLEMWRSLKNTTPNVTESEIARFINLCKRISN